MCLEESYFVDDSLDQVKLSLQRRVQQQSQRVELHPHAVIDAFRARFAQVGPLSLKTQSWWCITKMILKQPRHKEEECKWDYTVSSWRLSLLSWKHLLSVVFNLDGESRGGTYFPALRASLIQFTSPSSEKHIHFSKTLIMQPNGSEMDVTKGGNRGGKWVIGLLFRGKTCCLTMKPT